MLLVVGGCPRISWPTNTNCRRMVEQDGLGRAMPTMPQPYAIPPEGTRQRHSSGASAESVCPDTMSKIALEFAPGFHLISWGSDLADLCIWSPGRACWLARALLHANGCLSSPSVSSTYRCQRPGPAEWPRGRRAVAARPRDAGADGDAAGLRDAELRRHVAGAFPLARCHLSPTGCRLAAAGLSQVGVPVTVRYSWWITDRTHIIAGVRTLFASYQPCAVMPMPVRDGNGKTHRSLSEPAGYLCTLLLPSGHS
jgi:hypothetical protein